LLPPSSNGPGGPGDVYAALGLSTGAQPRFSVSLATTRIGSQSTAAAIKEDGTFRFPGLGTGTYLLNIGGVPEGSYLKSARFGEQDLASGPVDLTSGGGGTIAVVLSSRGAEIAGIAGASGAIVTAWPRIPDQGIVNGGVKQVYADQDGAFRITSLAPGEYYVAAWDELEPGLWQGAEFLTRFNGDASSIKLKEGAHATLDPKMISRERLVEEMEKLP
jgi:hypothetical protein